MIPVTIVGGYLGAGKTTLINNMLRNASGQRLAILVNEFGELPIDEDLIEAQSDEMISLAGGCICCSFGDNLVEALVSLSKLDPAPDHIVVEASGVAIPGSIAASLSLVLGFRLNALVVLADGGTALDLARDKYMGDTILRQLEDADLVVMTKADLVSAAHRFTVMDWLKKVARQLQRRAAIGQHDQGIQTKPQNQRQAGRDGSGDRHAGGLDHDVVRSGLQF